MGVKYLKTGDPQPPPLEAGQLRLYSMLYCPFAQRPRLVLAAKGVPFQMVDINLKNKPEWYSSVHPETKVPALQTGDGEVVIESLDISDYLDRKFPEPALWPTDRETKARHQQLLEAFGKVLSVHIQLLRAKDTQAVEGVVPSATAALQPFENELAKTGSKFFGGDRPGMLDYMIWPWAERCEIFPHFHPSAKFPLQDFPKLMAWGAAMKQDPAVRATVLDIDKHSSFMRKYLDGSLDFDQL